MLMHVPAGRIHWPHFISSFGAIRPRRQNAPGTIRLVSLTTAVRKGSCCNLGNRGGVLESGIASRNSVCSRLRTSASARIKYTADLRKYEVVADPAATSVCASCDIRSTDFSDSGRLLSNSSWMMVRLACFVSSVCRASLIPCTCFS